MAEMNSTLSEKLSEKTDEYDYDQELDPDVPLPSIEGLPHGIEAGNVEPHQFIMDLRNDFFQDVKLQLNRIRSEGNSVESDLKKVCDKLNDLEDERKYDRTELKSQLIHWMDRADTAVALQSRIGHVREQSFSIKNGGWEYWKGKLDTVKQQLNGVNIKEELSNPAESEIKEWRTKQDEQQSKLTKEIKSDLDDFER